MSRVRFNLPPFFQGWLRLHLVCVQHQSHGEQEYSEKKSSLKGIMRYVTLFFLQGLVLTLSSGGEYPACQLAKSVQDAAEPIPRIVVIGDVHGESVGFKQNLYSAGIIGDPAQSICEWVPQAAPGTVLIQVGDIVDRGPDAIGAWNCIKALQHSAPDGSSVIRLVGNHVRMAYI